MLLAGVVDEYVEPAEAAQGVLDEATAETFIADIAGHQARGATLVLDQAFGLVGVAVLVQIGDRHLGALACEGDGDGAADAAVAAGDERDASGEPAAAAAALRPDARTRRHRALDARLPILVLRRQCFLLFRHAKPPPSRRTLPRLRCPNRRRRAAVPTSRRSQFTSTVGVKI